MKGYYLGGSSLPQKVVFSLVCLAVVVLLAPYAGCHAERFDGHDSSEERAEMNGASSPAQGRESESTAKRDDHKPLGQIEDLLSN